MCRYTYTECTEHLTGMSPMAVIRVVFVAFVCMLVYSYVWTCSAEHPRDMWQMTSSHIAVCLRVWASVCEGVCPAYSLLIMFITCTIPDGAFMYLCISVWPYSYMYVCMHVCMYAFMHASAMYECVYEWARARTTLDIKPSKMKPYVSALASCGPWAFFAFRSCSCALATSRSAFATSTSASAKFLCVCVCGPMCIYMCMYMYAHTYVHACMHTQTMWGRQCKWSQVAPVSVYVCTCIDTAQNIPGECYVTICTRVTFVCVYAHMLVCLSACLFLCICLCILIYTHTKTSDTTVT